MSRLVKRVQNEPYKLVADGKDKYLCRCGLSRNQPFCDGSHNLVTGEEPGRLYWYDDAGNRYEHAGNFPRIRTS